MGKGLFTHGKIFDPLGVPMTSRLDDLREKRAFMWACLQGVDSDKTAPLMNQWRALDATIAELESQTAKAGDPVDEIAARRSARGGATARLGRAEGRAR